MTSEKGPYKPVIVTGCGRSGTHWVGHMMQQVFGPGAAAHEPKDPTTISQVVVDPRLRFRVGELARDGHRIVHLTRDGRDVTRSLYQWYMVNEWTRTSSDGTSTSSVRGDQVSFRDCCIQWRQAIEMMKGCPVLRVEDLANKKHRDISRKHTLPHWSEWDRDMTEMFWDICGEQMEGLGYKP